MKKRDIERERVLAKARRTALREQRAAELVVRDRTRRLHALDDPGAPMEPTPSTAQHAGFCAVCTAETPAGAAMRPLGRDGALVIVCAECDDTHPRSGRYSFECDDTHPRSGRYSFSESAALPRPTSNSGGNEGNRRRGGEPT